MNRKQLTRITRSVEETRQWGQRVGKFAQPGLVIALHGDLGAGKTALAQGIASGLGIHARVTSPTFTLVNCYTTPAGFELIHIDCYRLGEGASEAALEAAAMGLGEILEDAQAVVVIEWAERVAGLLPSDCLAVSLSQVDGGDTRQLVFQASGAMSTDLLARLANTQ